MNYWTGLGFFFFFRDQAFAYLSCAAVGNGRFCYSCSENCDYKSATVKNYKLRVVQVTFCKSKLSPKFLVIYFSYI